jgi:hypothetical protein
MKKMLKQNVGTFSKMLTNIMTKMLMKRFEQMLDSTIFVYTNVGATFQKMLVQLFMKNVDSTFCLKNVVTFF